MSTITIAGVDRTADLRLKDTSIERELTSHADSMKFLVKSGNKPAIGEAIVVDSPAFAGIIDSVKDVPRAYNTTFYQCTARDYSYLMDKRLVVETYLSGRTTYKRAHEIVEDIIAKYCSGFTTTNVESSSAMVDEIQFNYVRPTECMKQLCDYIGWDWFVDENKDVHFFDPNTLASPAPVAITDSNALNFKYNLDATGLRNRVYVRGATYLSDPMTISWKSDGAARQWVLPWPPHDVSLLVNAAAVTVGIENVDDDDGTYNYFLNFSEKYIRCAQATTTPAADTLFEMTARQDIPVISYREDVASQAAIAAVQGGDGIYEHVIVDDTLVTNEAAEALATADLKLHANPVVKGSFDSRTAGWEPGQIVDIDVNSRGIDNTFTVQKITITPVDTSTWNYHIEFGGRLLGIDSLLKALVSAQQNKHTGETEIIQKFNFMEETATATEALSSTLRTPPWICGDADAICGFVVIDS